MHVNKFQCTFPLVDGGDHFLCSGGYAPLYCNSEGVSDKAHHLCGQSKSIQSTGKVLFQPRNEICHHIRDLCRGCDVFVERRKMQHPTRTQVGREKVQLDLGNDSRICSTRSMTDLSLFTLQSSDRHVLELLSYVHRY